MQTIRYIICEIERAGGERKGNEKERERNYMQQCIGK